MAHFQLCNELFYKVFSTNHYKVNFSTYSNYVTSDYSCRFTILTFEWFNVQFLSTVEPVYCDHLETNKRSSRSVYIPFWNITKCVHYTGVLIFKCPD